MTICCVLHMLSGKYLRQGPKGMPDQEISVQNKDKQPKNLKK